LLIENYCPPLPGSQRGGLDVLIRFRPEPDSFHDFFSAIENMHHLVTQCFLMVRLCTIMRTKQGPVLPPWPACH
jgi:hypothetical protein